MARSTAQTALTVTIAVAAGMLATANAQAVSLIFSAPDGCGDAAEVEAGVERITGKPFSELASSWSELHASIEIVPEGFRLRVLAVSTDGVRSERSLVAATCGEAVEAARVVLATSLAAATRSEPNAPPAPIEPPRASASEPPVPNEPPESPPPPQREPERRDEPGSAVANQAPGSRLFGAVRAGIDAGLLPSPSAYAEIAVGLASTRFRIETFAVGMLPNAVGVAGVDGKIDVSLLGAGLSGCYRLLGNAPTLSGCAKIELGRLHAKGDGVPNPRSDNGFWSAALIEGLFRWPLRDRVAFLASATAVFPFERFDLIVEPGYGYRTGGSSFRAGLGLDLSW